MISLPSPICCNTTSSPSSRADRFPEIIHLDRSSMISAKPFKCWTLEIGNRLRSHLRKRAGPNLLTYGTVIINPPRAHIDDLHQDCSINIDMEKRRTRCEKGRARTVPSWAHPRNCSSYFLQVDRMNIRDLPDQRVPMQFDSSNLRRRCRRRRETDGFAFRFHLGADIIETPHRKLKSLGTTMQQCKRTGRKEGTNLVCDLIEYGCHVSHMIDREYRIQHLALFAMLVICRFVINENHKKRGAGAMVTHEESIPVLDPGQGD